MNNCLIAGFLNWDGELWSSLVHSQHTFWNYVPLFTLSKWLSMTIQLCVYSANSLHHWPAEVTHKTQKQSYSWILWSFFMLCSELFVSGRIPKYIFILHLFIFYLFISHAFIWISKKWKDECVLSNAIK